MATAPFAALHFISCHSNYTVSTEQRDDEMARKPSGMIGKKTLIKTNLNYLILREIH